MMEEIIKKASNIKLAAFDVDGVMTDGSLFLSDRGEEHKVFNVRDGLGLVMLKTSKIRTAVITGRRSAVVSHRMDELGIDYIRQGIDDKASCLTEIAEVCALTMNQVAYVGDDLNDIPALNAAGLAFAVADAHKQVLETADWVTHTPGGRGAVREVCEFILDAQGLSVPFSGTSP